jgi:hypothetical protein
MNVNYEKVSLVDSTIGSQHSTSPQSPCSLADISHLLDFCVIDSQRLVQALRERLVREATFHPAECRQPRQISETVGYEVRGCPIASIRTALPADADEDCHQAEQKRCSSADSYERRSPSPARSSIGRPATPARQ